MIQTHLNDPYSSNSRGIRELLNGFYELVQSDENFLIQNLDLPADLKGDFVLARNLFSVGFEDVGLLIAARGFEGVIRKIAEVRKIMLDVKGKTLPAYEVDLRYLIETMGQLRWRNNSARVIEPETKALLHYLRTLRNSSAHPREQKKFGGMLERSALDDRGALFLRRAKTGVPVFVPLPPLVVSSLQAIPPLSSTYFFWSGRGDARSAIQGYERSFRKLFRIADIRHSDGTPKRCHAHMFRDTFAVELLLAAVPVDQVSMLLGHRSVRMTEKHYLPWVQARQKQLTRSIRRAWFREVKVPGFSSAQTQPRQISTPTHTPHSFADS